MNRHQKRVHAKARRIAAKSKAAETKHGVFVSPEDFRMLNDARNMLIALTKEQGRVRIKVETLQGLRPHDTIGGKKDGDTVLLVHEVLSNDITYVEPVASPAEEETAS